MNRSATFALLGLLVSGFSFFISANAAAADRSGAVFLLLHGLDSDETKWNDTVRDIFGGNCRSMELGDTTVEKRRCYRYHFSDGVWPNGDGLSFGELGNEVGKALDAIDAAANPAGVVLVGHSRGGLAARAWLQSQASVPPFKVALVSLGSPHLGSPFGRIKPWMDRKGYDVKDVVDFPPGVRDQARFLFSPSTGYLATDSDEKGQLRCDLSNPQSVSYAICSLKRKNRLDLLVQNVTVFGQMTSSGLALGEKAVGGELDLLSTASVAQFLPGSFKSLRGYILKNIARNRENFCNRTQKQDPASWACNGDGVVPRISQNLRAFLRQKGFRPPAAHVALRKVPHTKLPDQTRDLQTLLNAVAELDADFK